MIKEKNKRIDWLINERRTWRTGCTGASFNAITDKALSPMREELER